jgi:hypothetical protein
MKKIAGLMCLASVCASVIFIEYEAISRLGGAFVITAGGFSLALLTSALCRAPQGYEGADGLHLRTRNRRSGLTRRVRFSQGQLRRRWT